MYSCKILSGDKLKFEPEQGDYLSKKKTCKNNGEEDDFSNMPWKRKMEDENSVSTWER